MKRLLQLAIALAGVAAITFATGAASGGSGSVKIARDAAAGKLKPATLTTKTARGKTVTRTLPFLSDATLAAADEAACEAKGVPNCDERMEAADAGANVNIHLDGAGAGGKTGVNAIGAGPGHTLGCGRRNSNGNTRVNQDCTFRRQAEEEIVYNPNDPNDLVAGQNDSRVGYNQCGTDFSTSNGRNWGDELPPFRQHLNNPAAMEPVPGDPNRHTIVGGPGTIHTYDAGSDPALAMDSSGRAYFSCVIFDVASNASGLYVTQSPAGADGSFYFNVGPTFGREFMVAEDNSPLAFHDKNFIAADIYKSSPNRDNVYVTWTIFRFDQNGNYQRSPIYGSMSTDNAVTWSTPEEISGVNDQLCFFGNFFDPTQNPHACNFDQGSDPVVLPNGDLEVIFNNGNTPAGNPNGQQLGVHCHPTGDSTLGTAHLNCANPVKVGDDIVVNEPRCDFGRGPEECIPGAFIRTNDFPRITTENTHNNRLYAVWQDYRNGEFDIQMSISNDGGLTWTPAGQVNPDSGLDHYFPAVDQARVPDRAGVSYYRTDRIPGENTTPTGGFLTCNPNQGGDPAHCNAGTGLQNSDYVLAGGKTKFVPYAFRVISPVFVPPDGIQTGFNGDYSGLVINKGALAHPIWSDTRNVDPYAPANGVIHDEDVFTTATGLPNGRGHVGEGTIGKPRH